ncbi:MAG: hypothetical protein WCK29_04750, partial [archaeon]
MKKDNLNLLFAMFQIALMLGMMVSFCYFINQGDNSGTTISNNNSGMFLKLLKVFDKIVFNEKTLVSADMIYTCPVDKNGSVCQEYGSSVCNDQCSVSCLPTSAEHSADCKPGTCYDSSQGICELGSTKAKCQNNNGQWFDDASGNVAQCTKGCCINGNEALFVTEQRCNVISNASGIVKNFHPEIKDELSCLGQSNTSEEGACVLTAGDVKKCKFTNKLDCMQTLKGQFSANVLCSNPGLGLTVNCTTEQTTSCVDGKDEVYWYDSCGNRENIYEGNSPTQKEHSYNAGVILQKSDSCSVKDGSNLLANQKTCGNCDYYQSSKCGNKTASEFLSGINSDVVCKSLDCVDENGKTRVNGESWCNYEGWAGTDAVDGGYLRATSTVGSRSFKKVCMDGEVRTEPCSDFRTEFCVQSDTAVAGQKVSIAACKK